MKQPTSDSDSNRFDSSRFETLPDCSIPEAAWMAGVAEEAMQRYLDEANVTVRNGALSLVNLLRATFTLLGRRENQSIMLREQLSTALERERELSETLRAGLLGSGVSLPRQEKSGASVRGESLASGRKITSTKKKKKK